MAQQNLDETYQSATVAHLDRSNSQAPYESSELHSLRLQIQDYEISYKEMKNDLLHTKYLNSELQDRNR